MNTSASPTHLFSLNGIRAVELTAGDVPRLQHFFERNPEYFFIVTSEGPGPADAAEEVRGELPAGWPFTKKWIIGFEDAADSLVGMANVVSDLLAPTIWHIGLFVVATTMHGSGVARGLYLELEEWMRRNGAQWLRLGVVQGNARAERFWERNGFVEVRTRAGVEMGKRVNTLRVMAKPLAAGTLAQYLALESRDLSGAD